VRREANRFIVASGHEEPTVERVVDRARGYAVVEKFRPAMERIVRRLDPRAA
jgi:hypothetical protein